MNTIYQQLIRSLEAEGYRAKTVPVVWLTELNRALCEMQKTNIFDKLFSENCLSYFNYDPLCTLQKAASVLITAIPQPMIRPGFVYEGTRKTVALPPTYLADKDRKRVTDIVTDTLKPHGYSAARFAAIPLKLLAVCSGLSRYGRNNITYIPEFGSYYTLYAFLTDLTADEDPWQAPARMDLCDTCDMCRQSCPTGSIPFDRDIIRAENCLTYFNESEEPFPDWIDNTWHNAIVGCMRCQEVCPANRGRLKTIERPDAFDEEETRMLLCGREFDSLPQKTKDTLEDLGLSFSYRSGVFSRNLKAALANAKCSE